MTILYADCNCRHGVPFVDGALPVYLSDRAAALSMFAGLAEQRRRGTDPAYWAIHFDGRHILAVLG